MTGEVVAFAVLGFVAVASAIAVVVARNPVHAVLYLVANFFTLAMLYLVLSAEFVAFLQILVYAGAIMVLFLFTVMFLNMTGAIESVKDPLPAQKWVALALGVLLVAEFALAQMSGLLNAGPGVRHLPAGFGSAQAVGEELFQRYLLPFEVTSVLLLVAMVGAVVLARRKDDA